MAVASEEGWPCSDDWLGLSVSCGSSLGAVPGFRQVWVGPLAELVLQQAFHQGLVGLRRTQVRLQFQGLLIGVDRGVQLAAAGQGVTAIVMGAGVVAFGKALGGLAVPAGFVQGDPLPLAVLEMRGGLGRALLLEQVLALLVRAQP